MYAYLDSNVVIELGIEFSSIEARALLSLAKDAGVPLHVTDVVLREVAHRRAEMVVASIKSSRKAIGNLGGVLGLSPPPEVPSEEVIFEKLKNFLVEKLQEKGIEVLPLSTECQPELIESVIREINRGKKGGSDLGYRDGIIISSVIDHVRKTGCGEAIFASKDGRLRSDDVRGILDGLSLKNLSIMSLGGLKEAIKAHLEEKERQEREALEKQIERFLVSKKDQLENLALQNREALGGFWVWSQPRDILSVSFDQILDLSWSWEEAEKVVSKKCRVSCKVLLKTESEIVGNSGAYFIVNSAGQADERPYQPEEAMLGKKVTTQTATMTFEVSLIWKNNQFVDIQDLVVKDEPPQTIGGAMSPFGPLPGGSTFVVSGS